MREKRIQIQKPKSSAQQIDARFGKMFTDAEFKIDKNSEAYKLVKPQEKKGRSDDIDSIEDMDDQGHKSQNLNKLFAGEAENSYNNDDGN